jgi:GNAT superfamily N-acetyltransferase
MPIEIACIDSPSDADREAILQPLIAYNKEKTGPSNYEPLAIMLRDDDGTSVGGLWGNLHYNWLFVELLFIPERLRNADFGSKLLAKAEEIAQQKGCVGVWLNTYSFQAPGFYWQRGYEPFGSLNDYPKGADRIFFRKLL